MTRIRADYEARCASKERAQADIVGHLPFLYETACSYDGVQVIELGVRRGNSTSAFLAAVHKKHGHLWSVDVQRSVRNLVPQWWHDLDYWTLHTGRSLGARALQKAPRECDVLFLDASHTETYEELQAYAPRVRPGGMVLAHDTDNPLFDGEVSRAMDHYFGEWENRTGCEGLGMARL